jgi:membrane-associated protease RseP (regulator of RpoE activity)
VGIGTLTVYAADHAITGPTFQDDQPAAYLGVSVVKQDAGVAVVEVAADSPASAAGIEVGDIIQQVDDTAIETPHDLVDAIAQKAPGDTVQVQLLRGEEQMTLDVTLEERPAEMAVSPFPFGQAVGGYQLGVQYRSLTPEIAESEGLPVEEGALITEVLSGSPAEDAGLQVDDIIVAVDGDKVDAEHTLSDRLYAYEAEDRVTFTVRRGDETLEIGAVLAAGHPGRLLDGMGLFRGIEGRLPQINIEPGQLFPPRRGNDGRGPLIPEGTETETIVCRNADGSIQFSFTVPKGMLDNFELPGRLRGVDVTCERESSSDSGSETPEGQNM